jgi:alkaline phosphatase D
MTRDLSRRTFVAGSLAAGASALAVGTPAAIAARRTRRRRTQLLTEGSFPAGVASGFPGQRDAILWTRVGGVDRDALVRLEVARDPGFSRVVKAMEVRVPALRDFTVHQRVEGLKPGEEYFYRFATRRRHSPVGRMRTARPADSREPVRIGFFSCQDYQAGYYPGHAALAKEPDLDLVVCLGDYVYEKTYYDGPAERRDHLGANGDAFVVTLPEWRAKYRMYQADPDLQAMHAAHPFIAVWDDHEVEDNYAGDKRDPAKTDVQPFEFKERRRAGYLAFYEAMPRRRASGMDTRIYGSTRFGRNLELFMLDQRQYRDPQPCKDQFVVPCADTDAPRTFLGADQKQWFKDAVPASDAAWKVVANQLMIMSLDTVPGMAVNVDSWDGYAAERREILEHFAARGVRDLAFITGDIHTFFAGNVTTTGRQGGTPVGTEFVGGSVTSHGLEEYIPGELLPAAQDLLKVTNPHLAYLNFQRGRGYGVLEATTDSLSVQFKAPETVLTRNSPVSTIARFKVRTGVPRVERD